MKCHNPLFVAFELSTLTARLHGSLVLIAYKIFSFNFVTLNFPCLYSRHEKALV